MALTDKQARFVEEYLVDLNATKAAIRAGYSEKSARQIGAETLHKPEVAQAVSKALSARSARTGIDQDWVLTRLVENAERALQSKPVLDRKGAATGVYAYQGAVANKALELLGRHLGMFKDNSALAYDHEEALEKLK